MKFPDPEIHQEFAPLLCADVVKNRILYPILTGLIVKTTTQNVTHLKINDLWMTVTLGHKAFF